MQIWLAARYACGAFSGGALSGILLLSGALELRTGGANLDAVRLGSLLFGVWFFPLWAARRSSYCLRAVVTGLMELVFTIHASSGLAH